MTEVAGSKGPLRVFAFIAAGIGLALIATWVVAILYWSWHLRAAVKGWESVCPDGGLAYQDIVKLRSTDYEQTLDSAGCRSLPHLVEALNTTKNPTFQAMLMLRIMNILSGPAPHSHQAVRTFGERVSLWELSTAESSTVRDKKLGDFNAWWASNGQRYHQGWRVWSSWCHGN
jgi:hypothetical protein